MTKFTEFFVGKAGNGVARTSAFPSTTWERGKELFLKCSRGRFCGFARVGSDLIATTDVQGNYSDKPKQQEAEGAKSFRLQSVDQMGDVGDICERKNDNHKCSGPTAIIIGRHGRMQVKESSDEVGNTEESAWKNEAGCCQFQQQIQRFQVGGAQNQEHRKNERSRKINAEPPGKADVARWSGSFLLRFFRFGLHGSRCFIRPSDDGGGRRLTKIVRGPSTAPKQVRLAQDDGFFKAAYAAPSHGVRRLPKGILRNANLKMQSFRQFR